MGTNSVYMYSSAHLKQVYNAVRIFHPDILEKIEPMLVKPEAPLKHTILLPALLKRFCELKRFDRQSIVGTHKGIEATEAKTLFIGIVITLYDPGLLTGIHSVAIRQNLSEELSVLLGVDRTWISQQTAKVRAFLNPYKPKPAYENFKSEVNKLSKVLETEFGKLKQESETRGV